MTVGTLLDRNREIARRCGDLSPLAKPVRDRLWEANAQVIMAGVSPGSTRPVAPLMPSTLRNRVGTGPPRAPLGRASRVVAGCVVAVQAGVGRITYTKSWPGLGEVARFLNDGTGRMRARPFFGFREIDREWIGKRLQEHVIPPKGFLGRLFGR